MVRPGGRLADPQGERAQAVAALLEAQARAVGVSRAAAAYSWIMAHPARPIPIVGAQTPASYGMFSRRLPPFEPPRTEEEDREVLLAGLTELGEHARKEGVTLFLEPLNRYEDHMVNRLEQAADLIRAVGLPSVRIGIDSYHMNIEETDPAAAILAHADVIGHAQVSDSNRFQPGAGHLDWHAWLGALHTIGYDGHLALECRLTGDPLEAVRSVPGFLKRSGA